MFMEYWSNKTICGNDSQYNNYTPVCNDAMFIPSNWMKDGKTPN